MLKRLWWLGLMLGCAGNCLAQIGAISGNAQLGGTKANVSGLQATNYQLGIVPSATVTVYVTGTTTLATIYANSSSSPLSNPFTANNAASSNPGGYLFYASISNCYDIVLSGGIAPNTYPVPVALTGVCVSGQTVITSAVNQIVAGTGISISPSSGTGVVTISGSGGTVNSVSVTTANGFSGTVANPTTTPVITINGPCNTSSPCAPATGSTAYVQTGTVSSNQTVNQTSGTQFQLEYANTQLLLASSSSGVPTLTLGGASANVVVAEPLTLQQGLQIQNGFEISSEGCLASDPLGGGLAAIESQVANATVSSWTGCASSAYPGVNVFGGYPSYNAESIVALPSAIMLPPNSASTKPFFRLSSSTLINNSYSSDIFNCWAGNNAHCVFTVPVSGTTSGTSIVIAAYDAPTYVKNTATYTLTSGADLVTTWNTAIASMPTIPSYAEDGETCTGGKFGSIELYGDFTASYELSVPNCSVISIKAQMPVLPNGGFPGTMTSVVFTPTANGQNGFDFSRGSYTNPHTKVKMEGFAVRSSTDAYTFSELNMPGVYTGHFKDLSFYGAGLDSSTGYSSNVTAVNCNSGGSDDMKIFDGIQALAVKFGVIVGCNHFEGYNVAVTASAFGIYGESGEPHVHFNDVHLQDNIDDLDLTNSNSTAPVWGIDHLYSEHGSNWTYGHSIYMGTYGAVAFGTLNFIAPTGGSDTVQNLFDNWANVSVGSGSVCEWTVGCTPFGTASGRSGTFTCSAGGTITVSNTLFGSVSDVNITLATAAGTITTSPAMKTVTPGTGFSVLCAAADTSVYKYDILH